MASIITDVQDGARPGHYDVQNIIDGLTGRRGQAFAFKTPTSQVTQVTADDNGVKASYDLGVHAPTRVLVDGYDLKNGMVTMWSGLVINIPACWLLCNGTLGTPDLRDRFVVGAGTSYGWGSVGGATTSTVVHTHDLSNHTHDLASHFHDLSNHTHPGDAHTHSHSHTGAAHTHSHAHTGDAHTHSHLHTGPSHSHTVSVSGDGAGFTNINLDHGGAETTANKTHAHSASTAADGTGNTGTDATGQSAANTGTDASAASFSTFTGTDASAASAANTGVPSNNLTSTPNTNTSGLPSSNLTGAASITSVSILPPYYGLFYIQRAA